MSDRPYVWQMVKEAMDHIGDKATYSEIKKYIHSKYDNVNDNTITCQIIACTVNHATRIHYPENKKPRISNTKYDFLYTVGRGQVEKYKQDKHGVWEIREDEDGKLIAALKQDENEKIKSVKEIDIFEKKEENEYTFPFEKHLRDFIVQNLNTIKFRGKTLSLYVDDNETDGVEYRTNVGVIDVLAVDEEDNFVIFELKLSRGNDATLGQILRYMGWIEKNISNGKKVSGVIVAKSIDEKLKYAVSQVQNVSLFEYDINFTIEEAKI